MVYSAGYCEIQRSDLIDEISIAAFPSCSHLATNEQRCSFELLRLAFFVLKLRKLEKYEGWSGDSEWIKEYELRCNLLRHAIFQQLLGLMELGAREQAMGLIGASS